MNIAPVIFDPRGFAPRPPLQRHSLALARSLPFRWLVRGAHSRRLVARLWLVLAFPTPSLARAGALASVPLARSRRSLASSRRATVARPGLPDTVTRSTLRTLASLLSKIERDEPFFGHLLHRVLRAFAPLAALLDAAERHQVDAAARCIVDVEEADRQPPRRVHRAGHVPGEDAGGQAERRGVGLREGVVEGVVGDERHDRREDFLA